jgi:hypothetical protein
MLFKEKVLQLIYMEREVMRKARDIQDIMKGYIQPLITQILLT